MPEVAAGGFFYKNIKAKVPILLHSPLKLFLQNGIREEECSGERNDDRAARFRYSLE
jgi:hypothetical protein